MAMTIEEIINIEEIKKLRSLYSHYYDANEPEKLCSLFTEDAVCEWDDRHGGMWIGREVIYSNYQTWMKKYPGYFTVMHAVTNPWIEITGPDTAEGRWFMLDYNFKDITTKHPLGTIGVYDDAYKKIDGEWKFYRIRLDFLWPNRTVIGGEPGHRTPGPVDLIK